MSMDARPEKTQSNAQRAARAIRELIFSGDLSPGSDHLETELAMRLGMSRTPIREAVVMLEGQGLLSVRPRKGVRILPVSPDDMREIYDVLTALESLAAENAAKAGHRDTDLAELADASERMDLAIGREDRSAWALADDDFHRELVRLGGNSRIEEIVERMSNQVRRARWVTLYVRPLPTKSNEDHREVYEAIRAGDAERARRQHQLHRQHARDVLVELLSGLGLNRV